MPLTQEALRDHLTDRVRRHHPEAVAALNTADLAAAHAEVTAAADATTVVAVLRRFDLTAWVPATVAFAAGLDRDTAQSWLAGFTRTVFLAGNPTNLTERFDFAAVDPTGSLAWTAPSPPEHTRGLRLLLRPFEAPLPLPPTDMVVPPGAAGPRRRLLLSLATAGVSSAQALVHLNHLLVEAVLDGRLGPSDRLRVRTVPRLIGLVGPFHALRVAVDPDNPDLLRTYACLTEETEND